MNLNKIIGIEIWSSEYSGLSPRTFVSRQCSLAGGPCSTYRALQFST